MPHAASAKPAGATGFAAGGLLVATEGRDRGVALDPLVLAFEHEPGWSSAVPDPRRRRSVLGSALTALLTDSPRNVVVLVARLDGEAVGAAAAWRPGYHPSALSLRSALAGVAIARHAGPGLFRVLRRWSVLRGAEPREPHWHLAAVGVRPDMQARGVGTALLASFIERVASDAGAAYLETSHPKLTEWYARFGFRQYDEFLLPGGVRTWTMWRSPTGSAARIARRVDSRG